MSARIETRQAGRPPIDDSLSVYLFVEIGRRQRGMSVHAYTSRRDAKYDGEMLRLGVKGDRVLQRESLRRRYNKARWDIGVMEAAYEGLTVAQPDVEMARETLERMIGDLLEQ